MKTDHYYTRVLTIAGSDSGGGAGIQADLKTFSALGAYGMSVVTALTAQNTREVRSVLDVDPGFVADQLAAVLEDIGVDAVKIGMLHRPEIIEVVAGKLKTFNITNIVLDPVMVAKSGDALLKPEAVAALRERLIPLARVLTPNLPEAGVLLGRTVQVREQMEQAALELLEMGPRAVLLKGGHLDDRECSADCLALTGSEGGPRIQWFSFPRVQTRNTHGTGCTLSSAIAVQLALGLSCEEAVRRAEDYVAGAIQAGAARSLGHGHGPVHHFYRLWDEVARKGRTSPAA